MTHAIEMALRLFSPKGALHEPSSGRSSTLGREEFLGALQVAAKSNPQGLQFLMADHLGDEQALASLLAYFSTTLDSDEAGGMAMAILLRRPLLEQLEHLVLSHPHYDKERRRAAVVMEKAKRAHRGGNDHEYQRLLAERNGILQLARDHCVAEMLRSGRCPHCNGTGFRPRKADECPKCHGSGGIITDMGMVTRRFGEPMRQAVERAVDEVLHQASDMSKLMDRQVREMRAA
ncbi:TIGR02642 family protein [Aeromonas caviae]|uniref:TIGR02642 family protein n=1 Tax=Aeromonas caviae TaxID=648 RepID=UPI001C21BCCD|nr:TIGR02642 family protein [Aeromonas caviae]QXB96492.1 hypothetical protein I6L36_06345 [Aeromonas sp. FDAARGOS 1406]